MILPVSGTLDRTGSFTSKRTGPITYAFPKAAVRERRLAGDPNVCFWAEADIG